MMKRENRSSFRGMAIFLPTEIYLFSRRGFPFWAFVGFAVVFGVSYIAASFYLFQRDDWLSDRSVVMRELQQPLMDQIALMQRELAKAQLARQQAEANAQEQTGKLELERLLTRQIVSAISAIETAPDQIAGGSSLSAYSPSGVMGADEGQVAIKNGLFKLHDHLQRKSESLLTVLRGAQPDAELEDLPGHQGGLASDPDAMDAKQILGYLREDLNQFNRYKMQMANLPIANPVPGAKITSRYGRRRDPFTKESRYHSGMDFKAPIGTPIYSSGNGVVLRAGWAGGYGKMVEIRHPNGLISRYAHMNDIAVKQGETVTQGRQIGKTGNTGRSTGPHLHYELRKNKKAYNPMPYLDAWQKLSADRGKTS